MTTRGLFLVFIAAMMTAAGNLMMREGVARAGGLSLTATRFARDMSALLREPLFDVGVALYGLASVVWFAIVSTERLNSSYPLLVSMTFVLVTVGATILFREPLSWQKIIGIAVILLGIIAVSTAR